MPLPTGKRPALTDLRTIQLDDYIRKGAAKPTVPATCNWGEKLRDPGMMMNDSLACCTCATAGHMVQTWTANEFGRQARIPDRSVERLYRIACGYDGTSGTDLGGYSLEVLKAWRKSGLSGHQIDAFAAVKPTDSKALRLAIWTFGGAYVGLQLPDDWGEQLDAGEWRTITQPPNPYNGHAVNLCGYDVTGVWLVTWGQVVHASWPFIRRYCDEAYAVLSRPDWAHDGRCPAGLDLDALRADLAKL